MAAPNDNISMALFCDFENVALGVRDANYDKFDIKPILERLLLKGSIVVKKAYCDWDRYKGFKAAMHEANFELIEIPHVRQSGKNSADIRLVVDALDLCYTKSHVNTFVIISGDSDFSPLVSKLRENAKQVIGVGVKQSTSDLLIANCDEFIFYDDLVREIRRTASAAAAAAKPDAREDKPQVKRSSSEEDKQRRDDLKTRAVEMAVETFEALVSERGDSGKMWASVLKQAIKRRKPDFNETYYGFRAFGNLLEEAEKRGLIELGRDEKSGMYVSRSNVDSGQLEPVPDALAPTSAATPAPTGTSAPVQAGTPAPTQTGRHSREPRSRHTPRHTREREAVPTSAAAPVETGAPVETNVPVETHLSVAVPELGPDSAIVPEMPEVREVPMPQVVPALVEANLPEPLQTSAPAAPEMPAQAEVQTEVRAEAPNEVAPQSAAAETVATVGNTAPDEGQQPRQARTGREGRSRSPLGRRPRTSGSKKEAPVATTVETATPTPVATQAVSTEPAPQPRAEIAESTPAKPKTARTPRRPRKPKEPA